MKFKSLKMKYDEYIPKYFLIVNGVVNTIRGLDEDLKVLTIFQTMFTYLHEIFNPKVSAIEEMTYLKTFPLDQLLGTLIAYDMRIYNTKPTMKELSFKGEKKPKQEHNNDSCHESDEEKAKFMRILKRGLGKYKCKLPTECFNYGKFGNYDSKCCENKNKEYDPRENFRKIQKDEKKAKTKIFYI